MFVFIVLFFLPSSIDATESAYTTVSLSDASFSCQSNEPPIWNRIKSLESMQNLAIGDRKTSRFKDPRYVISLLVSYGFCNCDRVMDKYNIHAGD